MSLGTIVLLAYGVTIFIGLVVFAYSIRNAQEADPKEPFLWDEKI